MNIGKAKIDKDAPEMSVLIGISIANNEYLEKLSNSEGLTFDRLFEKMLTEHKLRGFTDVTESGPEQEPERIEDTGEIEDGGDREDAGDEREGSVKKDKNKKSKNSK